MSLEPGSAVRSIDNPGRRGIVTSSPPRQRPSGTYLQIQWSEGQIDWSHEDELEPFAAGDASDPFALAGEGRYGRAGNLRRNLTYVHLSGRLANLVYAMGITNTDFYAHQYRPLLTLLDSPATGLLIADEVGLGKTIEAGLIWTEFRARFDFRRLVVVCPAMLREKWRDELRNRFGIDAHLVDAVGLHDALEQPARTLGEGRAWIISYNGARPSKSWRYSALSAENEAQGSRSQLADFLYSNSEDEPLIDLVVFDEAHYMRNSETATWRLGNLLRDVSAYQLMLSATPINLKNRDLYNLLNLLDTDHFGSQYDFERLLEANQPLVAARDVVLNLRSTASEVAACLETAARQPILSESSQLRTLLDKLPTDEQLADRRYRAELAGVLERLNLLSHVVTRSRKRDVQERRIIRMVRRESIPMNAVERELYDLVTETTRQYAIERGISDGFLLATPQRQVTSCPAAVARAWQEGGAVLNELIEDFEVEEPEVEEREDVGPLKAILQEVIPSAIDIDALERSDSKFTRFMEVAGEFLRENPGGKLIVFTTYRATARYLVDRLNAEGLHSTLIWGDKGATSATKQEMIDVFRDSQSLRILVSTEVAAEGVDLQFCRVLVNYDLPWNPTRIEQRIGRIDRLGQKAEIIHIWNLYFEETIDARIVDRLFDRLRVFEEALGEAEAVVGDAVRRLESALLNRPLTPAEEEAQIDQAALALENLRQHREELERNAAHMMAHGQHVIERIEAAQELARRVTETDLFVYVRDYLADYCPGHQFLQDSQDRNLVTVQLPADVAARFTDYLQDEGLMGKTALDRGRTIRVRFLNRISEQHRYHEEVMHQFHPLVRFITHDLRSRDGHFYPLAAVEVEGAEGDEFQSGEYAFFVRSWLFRGVREEEVLSTAAFRVDDGKLLDEESSELLLQRARLSGVDWVGASNEVDPKTVIARFEQAEEVLDQRYRTEFSGKKNENADRARFQLDSVDRYMNRRLQTLNETLRTHEVLGRTGLVRATQGQINKLKERMAVRRQRIVDQATVVADKNFVCAGLIRVQ